MEHQVQPEVLVRRLIDALDDRVAEIFDERQAEAPRVRGRDGICLAVASLGLGVAATAVAPGGAIAVVAIWLAIAVVNVAGAMRR